MATHIDTLLNQVADHSLREDLRREITNATATRDFGLVFNKHGQVQ